MFYINRRKICYYSDNIMSYYGMRLKARHYKEHLDAQIILGI
jgi:hypothetical protein